MSRDIWGEPLAYLVSPRLERLPDPDTIRESEYRALWEMLTTATRDLPEREQDERALRMLGVLTHWIEQVERLLEGHLDPDLCDDEELA